MNRAGEARWEVERHATALDTARHKLTARGLPNDIEPIEADEDLVRRVDQILLRFMKLQDAIGSSAEAACGLELPQGTRSRGAIAQGMRSASA